MNTENTATASTSAAVIDAPNKAKETPAKQVEQVDKKVVKMKHSELARHLGETDGESYEVTFACLGSNVSLNQLEKAIQDLHSDASRVAKLAMEKGYGRDVKSIAGTALKVVNLPAVRAMAKDGLLGDKDKTAVRVANIVALNQFVDSLQQFGLMRRTVEK